MEGALWKQSDTLKQWRLRWFVLERDSSRLTYRERRDTAVKGTLPLVDVTVGPLQSPAKHQDWFCFFVSGPAFTYALAAESDEAAKEWMCAIQEAAVQATARANRWAAAASSLAAAQSGGGLRQLGGGGGGVEAAPVVEAFPGASPAFLRQLDPGDRHQLRGYAGMASARESNAVGLHSQVRNVRVGFGFFPDLEVSADSGSDTSPSFRRSPVSSATSRQPGSPPLPLTAPPATAAHSPPPLSLDPARPAAAPRRPSPGAPPHRQQQPIVEIPPTPDGSRRGSEAGEGTQASPSRRLLEAYEVARGRGGGGGALVVGSLRGSWPGPGSPRGGGAGAGGGGGRDSPPVLTRLANPTSGLRRKAGAVRSPDEQRWVPYERLATALGMAADALRAKEAQVDAALAAAGEEGRARERAEREAEERVTQVSEEAQRACDEKVREAETAAAAELASERERANTEAEGLREDLRRVEEDRDRIQEELTRALAELEVVRARLRQVEPRAAALEEAQAKLARVEVEAEGLKAKIKGTEDVLLGSFWGGGN